MARLKLHRYETERDSLPELCMACGQPATAHIRRTFSWFPPWLYVLFVPALLIFYIVAMVLTKRMTVEVPVCDRHKGYWWKRTLLMFLPLLAICALTVVLAAVLEEVHQGSGGYACVGTAAMFIGWVGILIYIRLNMIWPAEITDTDITLKRVHQDFVAAFERMERPRRRRRDYDDDDFDDRPVRPRRAPVDEQHREAFRPDREDRPPRPRPPRDERDTFRADPGD